MRRLVAGALLLAACKSGPSNGYAVDLTIVPGASLSSLVASIDALDIAVTGAESYAVSYPITNQLTGGAARWIYRPLVAAGSLTFAIHARAGSREVGFGQTDVTLAPGATTTGTVTLEAGGPGGSDGGTDGGGADMSGCTPDSCAKLHQDCDPVTLACVPCAAPPSTENRTSFYVDNANAGSVTGSQGCPYKTITAGLAAANATSALFPIVNVAAGTYSAAKGETFPLVVRKSITVAGAGAAGTVVDGEGNWSGTMFGSQANGAYHVTMVVGSQGGTVAVSGLALKPTVASPTAGYVGIFCDAGNLPNLPTPAPNITLSGLTVGPNYDTGIMVTNSNMPKDSACNAKVLASTVTGNFAGVQMWGDGNYAMPTASQQPVGLLLGDGTTANANTLSNNHNTAAIGAGLLVQQGMAQMVAANNTFTGNDWGANFAHYGRSPSVDFESNSFTANTMGGIYVQFDEYLIANGNAFTGNLGTTSAPSAGLTADGSSHVKARGNTFVGNDIGVSITGNGMMAAGSTQRSQVDFGLSASDKGNNVFSCNSLVPKGYDVAITLLSSDATPITLVGNSWDHTPPSMGVSGAAAGTDLVNAPLAGTAPTVTTGSENAAQTGMCPSGKVH